MHRGAREFGPSRAPRARVPRLKAGPARARRAVRAWQERRASAVKLRLHRCLAAQLPLHAAFADLQRPKVARLGQTRGGRRAVGDARAFEGVCESGVERHGRRGHRLAHFGARVEPRAHVDRHDQEVRRPCRQVGDRRADHLRVGHHDVRGRILAAAGRASVRVRQGARTVGGLALAGRAAAHWVTNDMMLVTSSVCPPTVTQSPTRKGRCITSSRPADRLASRGCAPVPIPMASASKT
eukprot:955018-Prymnesium_polylepis.2